MRLSLSYHGDSKLAEIESLSLRHSSLPVRTGGYLHWPPALRSQTGIQQEFSLCRISGVLHWKFSPLFPCLSSQITMPVAWTLNPSGRKRTISSVKPKAQSPKPKAQSPKPKAQSLILYL